MDLYTVSFTYPRPPTSTVPGSFLNDSPNDGPSVEAVHTICMNAMAQFSVQANYGRAPRPGDDGTGPPKAFTFMVSGPYANVLAARGYIMRECPVVTRTSIPVPRSEILDTPSPLAKPSLKPAVRRRLDEVAGQTVAHLAVVNPSASPQNSILPSPQNYDAPHTARSNQPFSPFPAIPASTPSLDPEPLCHIVITGNSTAPTVAKVRLLVMLDELAGLHSDSIEIDCKLHPIIAGRKRATIQSIQEETTTNIYMPELGRNQKENTIWITGEFFGVQRARDMLLQMAVTKSQTVVSRDCAILPRKLDWMVAERLDEVKTIMSDNATYLEFPPMGSQTSVVSVFGDEKVNIHRTIRAVMLLATQHLSARFYLLPTHFNLLLPSTSINPAEIPLLLQHLAAMTNGNAEIGFKDNCFEFFGGEAEVRRGVAAVGDIGVVKTFHHEIQFQLELANEHREFISGKKNGKINKIMQLTGCRIRFETLTASPSPLSPPTNGGSATTSPNAGLGLNGANMGSKSGPPSPMKSTIVPATPNLGSNNPTNLLSPNGSVGGISPQAGIQGSPGGPVQPSPASASDMTGSTFSTPSQIVGTPISSSVASITNFLITLSGSTLPESLQGLSMLLEELPAEISFHVPESYHKRIIGVGGRTIQRIMKKYGVFVKFFNGSAVSPGEDWSPEKNAASASPEETTDGVTALALGDVEDNVVARTPAKNAINLENLKVAVLEMVNPKDKDFTFETVSIPRRYHRILLGEKSIFIKDIEAKTSSKVRFPDKETASDIVTIYGPESQVHIAAARLLDHVPFEADMTIPNHRDLKTIVSSQDFAGLCERMKQEYQVVIIPRVPTATLVSAISRDSLRRANGNGTHKAQSGSSGSSSSNSTDDTAFASFKFRCQRSNSDLLVPVREALDAFLASKGVFVGGTTSAVPSQPPTPAASTFGGLSGSLGAGLGLGMKLSAGSPLAGPDFKHRRADSFADAFPHFNSKLLSTANSDSHQRLLSRRIRMATSSPDVKALFNSHSHSPSQVYKLPEHDEQDDAGFQAPSQEGNEYYPPPAARLRHAPSISFIPGYSSPSEALKRGSDSRLEDKLKDQNRQRSLTNRAQSLDLTSLSRPDRLSAIRVPSPVDSAIPASPTSASAATPSFPSVNGPTFTNNNAPHYTHQNHYSFPNASYTQPSYHHQHHLSYSRPRTQVSLSSSSSSLSLSSAIEQPPMVEADADASVMDDVSRVISQLRLETLH